MGMQIQKGKGVPRGKRVSFHQAINDNRRASTFLFSLVLMVSVVTGYILGRVQGYPLAGVLLFFSIIIVLFMVTFSGGKKIPLFVNGAFRADREREQMVHNIVEELKIAAGLTFMPEVYIIENPSINAFASALTKDDAAVALTTGALEKLTREELQGILAHEISHILSNDSRYFLFMAVIVGSVTMLCDIFLRLGVFSKRSGLSRGWLLPAMVLSIISPLFLTILRFSISREREFLADAMAVQITRNPSGLSSALAKATSKGSGIKDSNRATGHMFILNPRIESISSFSSIFSTHPSTEERIKRLALMGL